MNVIFCFACLLIVPTIYSANILFVSVIPSVSHQNAFQPVWRELSLRGHNVHVVTPNPLKETSLVNLTEYDLGSHYDIIRNASADLARYVLQKPNFLMVFLKDMFMTGIWSELSETSLKHPEMQKLLRKDLKFDVAIIEWLFPTMAGLGAKYKCPIIGISSLGAPVVALDTVGNPSHPVLAPDHNLPVTRAMPFRERLMSVLYSLYVRVWYHLVVLPREDLLVKKYLGESLPYLGDVERNVSLLLLNRNPVFHRIMPVVPAIVEVGPIKVKREKQTLDLTLRKFLDKSKNGAIYFSLGSNLKSTYLSDEVVQVFLATFKDLPYNVVFKCDHDYLPGKPENVYIAKWLPQTAILEHPNIKLFITQGGLQSAEEAILTKVPIIGFPTHADQTVNVDTFVTYGVGAALDLEDITVERFNSTIHEVITNPSYKRNAETLARLVYDQSEEGLDRAVWWIEYVLRHKGAAHLRGPVLEMPWWKYLMLDIFGFLLALVVLNLFIVIIIFRKACRYILRKLGRENRNSFVEKKYQ